MEHLDAAGLVERLRAKIAAISDWLDEIEREAGGKPLAELTDLAELHGQLTKARAALRRRLAGLEATGDDSPESVPAVGRRRVLGVVSAALAVVMTFGVDFLTRES